MDARGSLTEDAVLQEAANIVRNAFREASLTVWVMKPLFSTAVMKEGTRNEDKIVGALPVFMMNSGEAYRCPIGASNYAWDEA